MRLPAFAAALTAAALLGCVPLPRERILREQDLRAADSRFLRDASSSWSEEDRRRAVLAMGRIQGAAYVEPLIKRLKDRSRAVREEAVFALGQLGLAETPAGEAEDPALGRARRRAQEALLPLASARRTQLRSAAVEALGKVGDSEAEPVLIRSLRDAQPSVRGEAALALFRQRFLGRVPGYSTAATRGLKTAFHDPAPEVRWKAVYAFSRFPESAAGDHLATAVEEDPEIWVKFFACRGLAQLKKEAPWEELVKALRHGDFLVRAEAVRALGLSGRADYLPDPIYADDSAHVRAAAADSLAATADPRLAYRLDGLDAEESPLVRGQVARALPVLRPAKAAELLSRERTFPHWWVRSRAYLATGELPGQEAALMEGLKDPDARVAAAALQAVAKSTAGAEAVEAILGDANSSVELLGTAAEAARGLGLPRFLPVLRAAYERPVSRRYPELSDGLRQAHAAILKAHPGAGEPLAARVAEVPEPSPFLGIEPSSAAVVFETDKGEIEIELAAAEAPLHATAFLESVRRGVYEGTSWHRVVSGFVIQGGDPRGSGWGDAGFSLRDEINRLRFTRGAVGMPKAGKDTGGCQVFITLVPAPHLDGFYTVFGWVARGLEVIDRIEPGDRILKARVKSGKP